MTLKKAGMDSKYVMRYYCPHCSYDEIEADFKFCPSCGKEVNSLETEYLECKTNFEKHILSTWKTGDGKPYIVSANHDVDIESWYGDDELGHEWEGFLACWKIFHNS